MGKEIKDFEDYAAIRENDFPNPFEINSGKTSMPEKPVKTSQTGTKREKMSQARATKAKTSWTRTTTVKTSRTGKQKTRIKETTGRRTAAAVICVVIIVAAVLIFIGVRYAGSDTSSTERYTDDAALQVESVYGVYNRKTVTLENPYGDPDYTATVFCEDILDETEDEDENISYEHPEARAVLDFGGSNDNSCVVSIGERESGYTADEILSSVLDTISEDREALYSGTSAADKEMQYEAFRTEEAGPVHVVGVKVLGERSYVSFNMIFDADDAGYSLNIDAAAMCRYCGFLYTDTGYLLNPERISGEVELYEDDMEEGYLLSYSGERVLFLYTGSLADGRYIYEWSPVLPEMSARDGRYVNEVTYYLSGNPEDIYDPDKFPTDERLYFGENAGSYVNAELSRLYYDSDSGETIEERLEKYGDDDPVQEGKDGFMYIVPIDGPEMYTVYAARDLGDGYYVFMDIEIRGENLEDDNVIEFLERYGIELREAS